MDSFLNVLSAFLPPQPINSHHRWIHTRYTSGGAWRSRRASSWGSGCLYSSFSAHSNKGLDSERHHARSSARQQVAKVIVVCGAANPHGSDCRGCQKCCLSSQATGQRSSRLDAARSTGPVGNTTPRCKAAERRSVMSCTDRVRPARPPLCSWDELEAGHLQVSGEPKLIRPGLR